MIQEQQARSVHSRRSSFVRFGLSLVRKSIPILFESPFASITIAFLSWMNADKIGEFVDFQLIAFVLEMIFYGCLHESLIWVLIPSRINSLRSHFLFSSFNTY